jgi:hypothetical protein
MIISVSQRRGLTRDFTGSPLPQIPGALSAQQMSG